MAFARYTDEKVEGAPLVEVYEVEQPAPPKKRPFWRRFDKVLMAVIGVAMLVFIFSPLHHCKGHRGTRYKIIDHTGIPATFSDDKPQAWHFEFKDLDEFYIEQFSQSTLPTRTEVVGEVIIHSPKMSKNTHHKKSHKSNMITVDFYVKASDDDIRKKLEFKPTKNGVRFSLDPMSLVRQKVNVTAFVTIPRGKFHLDDLHIKTRELNVHLDKHFATAIDQTTISTVSGMVTSCGNREDLIDSGHTNVSSVSGSVYGQWGLQHGLDIETVSGDIKVGLFSEKMHEVTGYLVTKTTSGNTTCHFQTRLHPRPLRSYHASTSGVIGLYYPKDWEGHMTLATTSGHLDIYGEGTKIIKKDKGAFGKEWRVVKGNGDSRAAIESVTGDIDVGVGNI